MHSGEPPPGYPPMATAYAQPMPQGQAMPMAYAQGTPVQGYPQAPAQAFPSQTHGAPQAQTYGTPQMPQAYGAPQMPQAYGVPQQGAYVASGQYVAAVPMVAFGASHSTEVTETYIGPATICITLVLCILVGPFGLIACCMPCDERRVTYVVNA